MLCITSTLRPWIGTWRQPGRARRSCGNWALTTWPRCSGR